MYTIIEHYALNSSAVRSAYTKVRDALERGDFGAADVKKLQGSGKTRGLALWRAKLNDTHRLLFTFGKHRDETVLLILEVVLHHRYQDSRFLRGTEFNEGDFVSVPALDTSAEPAQNLKYLNAANKTFHFLDKPISFSDLQEELFYAPLPLIIVGSAGSGKTVLTLEKLTLLRGAVLYTSLSPFLVENARQLYAETQDPNDEGTEVSFLSFADLLSSIHIPIGTEVSFRAFAAWCQGLGSWHMRNSRKLFEEFRGVIAGGSAAGELLSELQYRGLGIKQSIFIDDDRPRAYDTFQKYQEWMRQEGFYDLTLLASKYLPRVEPQFDAVVIDEVQDFTVPQLALVMKMLKDSASFLFCGDANQIVHPNYFSWSRVKSSLQHILSSSERQRSLSDVPISVMRSNFRNSQQCTALANRLLRLKQLRFGSIDKESNFLVESESSSTGTVVIVPASPKYTSALNERSRLSTRYAVIVLDDSQKQDAKRLFDTPLVFSVHEAKGLEYPHVILYGFTMQASAEYKNVVAGIARDEIQDGELDYSRVKDKSDKSLEVYKFYINALYVGITRALEDIYICDSDLDHPLWNLLALPQASVDFDKPQDGAASAESSAEEWQREARKLEQQGKREQADEIRSRLLKVTPVPWESPTLASLRATWQHELASGEVHRKKLIHIYEVAKAQGIKGLQVRIQQEKNSPIKNADRSREYMIDKYYSAYVAGRIQPVRALVEKYGVNFKNELGETPLLIAARLFKPEIVRYLLDAGADPYFTTIGGMTPARALLTAFIEDAKLSKAERIHAGEIWEAVAAPIAISVRDRLMVLAPTSIHYILLETLMVLIQSELASPLPDTFRYGLSLQDIIAAVQRIPDVILHPSRKSDRYLSGLMSRNEAAREVPYNRRIVLRLTRGYYVPNPLLQVRHGEEWKPLLDAAGFNNLAAIYDLDPNDKEAVAWRGAALYDYENTGPNVKWLVEHAANVLEREVALVA